MQLVFSQVLYKPKRMLSWLSLSATYTTEKKLAGQQQQEDTEEKKLS